MAPRRKIRRQRPAHEAEPEGIEIEPSIEQEDPETSKKRGYNPEDDQADEGRGVMEGNPTPPSKRRRSSNWPLRSDVPLPSPLPTSGQKKRQSSIVSSSKRRGSNTPRPSRFLEGSMNDKPSEKPPSVFTRIFHGSTHKSLEVDHLMEDYHSASGPSADQAPEGPIALVKSSSHCHNTSVSSIATDASKQSAIYRFGKSVASSFNPSNIWGKVVKNWGDAKDELIEEKRAKALRDEQARAAEEAYAAMKKAGRLGGLNFTGDTKIYTPGYTAPNVDVAGNSRAASEVSSANQGRKSSFSFFRSPSFGNLKRTKSEISLNPLACASSSSLSPGKEENRELRKSQSKKDLHRQQKLTKQISNLEAKLEEARRELNRALGDAPPPVPLLPINIKLARTARSRSRERSTSPQKGGFVPGALPSLPSERLLFPEQLEADDTPKASVKAAELSNLAADVLGTPITKGDIMSASFEDEDEGDNEATPRANSTLPKTPAPGHAAKKGSKKRRSANEDDLIYKPMSTDDDNDDDAEWSDAEKTTVKRRRSKGKKAKPAAGAGVSRAGSGKLSKRAPGRPRSSHKQKDKHNLRDANEDEGEGVIIEEETTTTTTTVAVKVKDAPSNPTAFATPSHFSKAPAHNKITKKRPVSRPRSRSRSRGRSASPGRGKDDEIITVTPGGDIPALPGSLEGLHEEGVEREKSIERGRRGKVPGLKEDFEWPDDVF